MAFIPFSLHLALDWDFLSHSEAFYVTSEEDFVCHLGDWAGISYLWDLIFSVCEGDIYGYMKEY